ncbi:MAG: PD-(D/E)XK nuclease family protein [Actinomycetota bacterium]
MSKPDAVPVSLAVKTMSPSKISTFAQCPKKFELSVIEGIREPSGEAQVRGTLVHAALESLFRDHQQGERTEAHAYEALSTHWEEVMSKDEDVLQAMAAKGEAAFLQAAKVNLDHYFKLEPIDVVNRIEAVGIEKGVAVTITKLAKQEGDPDLEITLRGIIDRLDREADGSLTVVDYKTGRAPKRAYERDKFPQLFLYAAMLKQITGEAPARVKLHFLGDEFATIESPVDSGVIKGQRERAFSSWKAIWEAYQVGEFQATPGRLCDPWCYYSTEAFRQANPKHSCPAYPGHGS